MFNLGFGEMIVIAVIALIFIGPKQLPEVAATVGRLLNELKRATSDLTEGFVDARDAADRQLREARKKAAEQLEVRLDESAIAIQPESNSKDGADDTPAAKENSDDVK